MNAMPDMHTTSIARAELRTAIENRRPALEDMVSAQEALKRAAGLLAQAETDFARFAALDEDIANAAASRVALWALNGGGEQPSLEPSPKHKDAVIRRDQTKASLHVMAAVHKKLADNYERLRMEFVAADLKVSAAATAVLIEEAQPIAARLTRAREEVWRCEALLGSLCGQAFFDEFGRKRGVSIGVKAFNILHSKEPPFEGRGGPSSSRTEAWKALHAALCEGNAEASLTGL
jgi:hypothetical protein